MPIVIRLAGTCPVCQGLFKVNSAHQMVHHGFTRPGDGNIHGDCFGVGWPAYQLSPAGCTAFRDYLIRSLVSVQERIERLRADPPSVLEEFSYATKRTREFQRGTVEYDRLLERKIRQLGTQETEMLFSKRAMEQLISSWEPQPLLEIDEEGLTPELRRERDSKRDERATQKAQREAERAAKRERIAQRDSAKEAEKDEYLRLLQILVSWPPGANRTLQSRRLNAAMLRKYPYGLSAEFNDKEREELARRLLVELELGVMEQSDDGYRRWFSPNRAAVARGKPQIE